MYARSERIMGALLAVGMVCTGCSDGSDTTGLDGKPLPESCDDALERLRSCGLLSQGSVDREETCRGDGGCVLECIRSRNCEQIEEDVCESDNPEGSPTIQCFESCGELTCDDDSGTYKPYDRCDGFEDCADGSDESGCPTFQCDDGEAVVESKRCDGAEHCEDGSDESGCPMFQCDSGETVVESVRCDGYNECSDGSDEAGCPQMAELTCGP